MGCIFVKGQQSSVPKKIHSIVEVPLYSVAIPQSQVNQTKANNENEQDLCPGPDSGRHILGFCFWHLGGNSFNLFYEFLFSNDTLTLPP